jgi:hypothetical protein
MNTSFCSEIYNSFSFEIAYTVSYMLKKYLYLRLIHKELGTVFVICEQSNYSIIFTRA